MTVHFPARSAATIKLTHYRDMALIPLTFVMTFDNFRTIRECRLIWRAGDFLGVAFQN
jgi:hypothetical protein